MNGLGILQCDVQSVEFRWCPEDPESVLLRYVFLIILTRILEENLHNFIALTRRISLIQPQPNDERPQVFRSHWTADTSPTERLLPWRCLSKVWRSFEPAVWSDNKAALLFERGMENLLTQFLVKAEGWWSGTSWSTMLAVKQSK